MVGGGRAGWSGRCAAVRAAGVCHGVLPPRMPLPRHRAPEGAARGLAECRTRTGNLARRMAGSAKGSRLALAVRTRNWWLASATRRPHGACGAFALLPVWSPW